MNKANFPAILTVPDVLKENMTLKLAGTTPDLEDVSCIETAGIEALEMLAERGLHFEGAKEALILERIRNSPDYDPPFTLVKARIEVNVSPNPKIASREANVKLIIQGREQLAVAEGDGPIDAFANALKKALKTDYPCVSDIHLMDYKVSLTNPSKETGADTKVAITTRCCGSTFTTVDVSADIVEASVLALCDAYELCLYRIMNQKKPSSDQD